MSGVRLSQVPDDDKKSGIRAMRYGDPKDKRGYLRKEGKTLKLKTRRYLCLTGKLLSHHKDENSPPSWTVDVNTIRAMPGKRDEELVIIHNSKVYSFFAQNKEDLNEWIMALKAARSKLEDWYNIGKEIGRGSYGTVHAGTDRVTGEKVAIKIIKKNPSSKRQTKFLEREVKILKSVDNPHVISTLDVFEDNTQVAIVSEFVEGGELFDRIIQEKSFTEDKAREVMPQVLVGVEYLHSIQVVHRDIKPENILCQTTEWPFIVKLTDFGLSNIIDGEKDNSNALLSHVGTSFYLAPEVVGKRGYGPGVDVWACGVVLYIMLCGRFPFWGKTDIEYLNSLQRGPDMQGEGWSSVSEEGKQFVRSLLDLNPNTRPSAKEALSMPWIKNIRSSPADGGLRKLESQAGIAAVVTKRKADNANLPRPAETVQNENIDPQEHAQEHEEYEEADSDE